jgi:hypothetical protein
MMFISGAASSRASISSIVTMVVAGQRAKACGGQMANKGRIYVSLGTTLGVSMVINYYNDIETISHAKPANHFARVSVAKSGDDVMPLDYARRRNRHLDRLPEQHNVGVIHMDFPSERGVKAAIDCNGGRVWTLSVSHIGAVVAVNLDRSVRSRANNASPWYDAGGRHNEVAISGDGKLLWGTNLL